MVFPWARLANVVTDAVDHLDAARAAGRLTDVEHARRVGLIEGWLRAKGAYFRPGYRTGGESGE